MAQRPPRRPDYRMQAAAFGDLDKATLRVLRQSKGEGVSDARPFEIRRPAMRDGVGLKTGALLVREWNGRLERVMILEKGFAWNGATYRSLSQIAKAMTGTNWNGHRFFGLRPANGGGGKQNGRKPTAVGLGDPVKGAEPHSDLGGGQQSSAPERGAS